MTSPSQTPVSSPLPARVRDGVPAARLGPGTVVPARRFETIQGEMLDLLDGPDGLTHLQFRRFAGCPICHLHLRAFARRRSEIAAASIREIVLFHSSREDLLRHAGGLPLPVVADPDKRLYRAFGVEAAARSLADPRVWGAIVRAIAAALPGVVAGRRPSPPLKPAGGRYGLPADFLVAPDGRVLACKYGEHADDQWSVDELLAIAGEVRAHADR